MPRVNQKILDNLKEFFDTLPAEARNKCALCNETLTHIVKSAEARTDAPTATVTRELADRINDGAAPGDLVSGERLRKRVDYQENGKRRKSPDKIETDNPEPKYQAAMLYAKMAIAQLESIQPNHHDKQEAFEHVIEWILKNRPEKKVTPKQEERQKPAQYLAKEFASEVMKEALCRDLHKRLHLNDFAKYYTMVGAGTGKIFVAEVTIKKIKGQSP